MCLTKHSFDGIFYFSDVVRYFSMMISYVGVENQVFKGVPEFIASRSPSLGFAAWCWLPPW